VRPNSKQPSCKKVCSSKKATIKCEIKGWGQEMIAIILLATTIQVNLIPNQSEAWRRNHIFTRQIPILTLGLHSIYASWRTIAYAVESK